MNRVRDLLIGASFAIAGLVMTASFAPRTAAAGWLTGFVLWSQIPVGSLVLLMIHRLTGGRWGDALRPALESAVRFVPLLSILIAPVLVAIPLLEPWVRPDDGVKSDVLSYYLNAPFFITRSLIAIAGWSALAFLLPRVTGRRGEFLAAIGLVFHAVVISAVAVDWVLSVEPPFISSSFGASMAITQLIAALAWALLWTPLQPNSMTSSSPGLGPQVQPAGDGRRGAPEQSRPASDRNAPALMGDRTVVGDIGGLLLAFLLAITYVDFMAFLVMWYSDLPARMSWFVERDHLPWSLLLAGAFVFGSAAPILALLLARVRNGFRELRLVAISVLIGLALYYAWLIAPPFRGRVLAATVLAIVAMGLIFAAVTGLPARNAVIRRRASHGA